MTGQVFPFPLYKWLVLRVCFGLPGVAASSLIGLHDRVLVFVVTPFLRSGCATLPFQRQSVKFFHIGLRVFLFVRALLILLISEIARSTIVPQLCQWSESK